MYGVTCVQWVKKDTIQNQKLHHIIHIVEKHLSELVPVMRYRTLLHIAHFLCTIATHVAYFLTLSYFWNFTFVNLSFFVIYFYSHVMFSNYCKFFFKFSMGFTCSRGFKQLTQLFPYHKLKKCTVFQALE